MPNHITTYMEIVGIKDQIDKLVEQSGVVRDDTVQDNKFDFNTIVPMPDDIYRGDLGSAEREKYGAKNWLDWSRANWGTKWNAYEVRYIEGNETKIVLSFQTAWSFPEPIAEALETQGFKVNAAWYDEDPSNYGEYNNEGGAFWFDHRIEIGYDTTY